MKPLLTLAALALLTSTAHATGELSYLLWDWQARQHGYLYPEAMVGGFAEITVGDVAASITITGFDPGGVGETMDVEGLIEITSSKYGNDTRPFEVSYHKDVWFPGNREPTNGVHDIWSLPSGFVTLTAVGFWIPEPATWGLLGVGVLAIAAGIRRKAWR